jgi:hypothetical protein
MFKKIITLYILDDRICLVLFGIFKAGIIKTNIEELKGYNIIIGIHRIEVCISLSLLKRLEQSYRDIARA